MKDYSKLEGKEITIITTKNGETVEYQAVVIGCDYDIGITIVKADDHNHYLFCLIGPSAPNFTDHPNALKEHKWYFFYKVRKIKQGILSLIEEDKLHKRFSSYIPSTGPTAESCPFN